MRDSGIELDDYSAVNEMRYFGLRATLCSMLCATALR